MPAKSSIKRVQDIVSLKNGKILNGIYENQYSKFDFMCSLGHIWTTNAVNIFSGSWCHACSGQQKLTLEQMQELAKDRSGKCLSDIYINIDTKLKWKCKENHTWLACFASVRNGNSWCPYCALLNNRKNKNE